jgi:hypothetical protein
MNIKYGPQKLDPRLDDNGQPVDGATGPFLSDTFEGFIEIRAPSYPERLRFPKELGIEDLSGGEDDQKEKLKRSLNQLEMLAKCAEKVKPFIIAVDLLYKPESLKLNTVDDLYDFPDAGPLITGLCTKFIMGFVEKKV